MTKTRLLLAALLAAVVFGAVVLIINPLNWGVAESSRFSFERFEQVHRGMTTETVVGLLGSPIRVVSNVQAPLCPAGSVCRNLIFADDPSSWVFAYKKAWVIVDQDGRVIRAILYAEP